MVEAGVFGERVGIVLIFDEFVHILLITSGLPSTDVSLGSFAHDVRHGRDNDITHTQRLVIHQLFLTEKVTSTPRVALRLLVHPSDAGHFLELFDLIEGCSVVRCPSVYGVSRCKAAGRSTRHLSLR